MEKVSYLTHLGSAPDVTELDARETLLEEFSGKQLRYLNATSLDALARWVSANVEHNLTFLDLRGGNLNAEAIEMLPDSLCSSLGVLILNDCKLGDQGILAVGNLLRSAKFLRHLDLRSNGMTKGSCALFGKCLVANSSIQELLLGMNGDLAAGLSDLKFAFSVHPQLARLDVNSCSLDRDAAKMFAELIKAGTWNVSYLIMYGNPNMGRAGADLLADALKENPNSLLGLDIAYCSHGTDHHSHIDLLTLGVAGEATGKPIGMAAALATPGLVLQELDLTGNQLLPADFKAFVKPLQVNKALGQLLCDDSPDFRALIQKITGKNTCLTQIQSKAASFTLTSRNCDRVRELHVALAKGDFKVAKALIGNSNMSLEYESVWSTACKGGSAAIVKLLLNYPLAVRLLQNAKVLSVACKLASPELLQLIAPIAIPLCREPEPMRILLKSSPKSYAPDTLYNAAMLGFSEIVSLLLKVGAPAEKLTKGLTALHIAVVNGHLDVCRTLIDACPALLLIATPSGNSILQIACKAGQEHVAQLLLDRKVVPTAVDLSACSTAQVARLILKCGVRAAS